MKVLMAASEAVPFVKTGGLADVIGSLPKALSNSDCDLRVILPKYQTIPDEYKQMMRHKSSFTVQLGWRQQYCGIEQLEYDGICFYFIDNEYYFKRGQIYDFHDEAERFAYFCQAVLQSLPYLDFVPDILHCHDWQTAMIPVLLDASYKNKTLYGNIRTILTIHNLKFQGVFPPMVLDDILGLGSEYFTADRLEFDGNINFLKGGIIYADRVTTVSRTYAEEITYEFYGEKLDGVLRQKGAIAGIVNGIDYAVYDPMCDSALIYHYRRSLVKKRKNKEELQRITGLTVNQDVPLIAIISRLTEQKGLDLIAYIWHELLSNNIQLVILGTGDKKYEQLFRQAAVDDPQRVSAHLYFDESLARKIYAGSDMFLMPSLFEPCGLSQLIALRYGSIPIVRETGGLKDTVIPFNQQTMVGNGFTFIDFNAHEMLFAVKRALSVYGNQQLWSQLVENAVKADYSWNASAKEYLDIYRQLGQ